MKRCPSCNQMFADDIIFCLNDGTVLDALNAPSGSDTPTQIFSPFPAKTVRKNEANKSIYAVIGAMAVLIIGLSAIVFYMMSSTKDEKKETEKAVENKSPSPPQTSPGVNQNQTGTVEKTPVPITEEAAQNLIKRWEQAQNDRNFKAYRSCYGEPFLGVKRTKTGDEDRMNYARWMGDRQKMLKNIIEIKIENPQVKIEGDTAIAQFIQHFQSVSYEDTGQKTMRIKMFPEGAKIVYEEIKYVY